MNNQNPVKATTATPQMRREDYKAVKHMDKAQMTAYLQRIYRRGYAAGFKTAIEQMNAEKQQAPSEEPAATEEVLE